MQEALEKKSQKKLTDALQDFELQLRSDEQRENEKVLLERAKDHTKFLEYRDRIILCSVLLFYALYQGIFSPPIVVILSKSELVGLLFVDYV